jgi:hypothetical protein
LKVNALIQSNLHKDPEKLDLMQYAEAAAQAIWLENWRLRQQAEMIGAMFGAKKKVRC